MEELLHEHSHYDIEDAMDCIDNQIDCGYIDVANDFNDVEMAVIKVAIKLFKEKYYNEKEND